MGFWENTGKAMNSFSNAIEKKQEELERKAKLQLREKSEGQLRNIIRNAEIEGKWRLQELAQEELERRGYY